MKDKYLFPCIFDYAEDGITVTYPDLVGIITFGEDELEALIMAKEALALHLFALEETKLNIPNSRHARDIKVNENQTVQLIEVYMPVVREQMNNQSVKKTLTIPRWMDTQIQGQKINLSGLLQDKLTQLLDLKKPDAFTQDEKVMKSNKHYNL